MRRHTDQPSVLILLAVAACLLACLGCWSSSCRPLIKYEPLGDAPYGRVHEFDDHYEVDALFPRSFVPFIDAAIEHFVLNEVDAFVRARENEDAFSWTDKLYLTCTTFTAGSLHCYKCDTYTYTGGAHGNTTIQTFVFDRSTQQELAVEDVFVDAPATWDTIAGLAIPRLKRALGQTSNAVTIELGAAPAKDNYRHFVISGDSVIFFFEHYAVAPYSSGQQRVTLSRNELRPVLAGTIRPE